MTEKDHEELSPQAIRQIREKLGLSQVEAGELLGGGPRAFTKYESGTIRPAASTSNLLRLLSANPSALQTLSGEKLVPLENDSARPLEVSGKHIAALSPRRFMMLIRRLLDAEALTNDLPMDGIHVADNITASDGGEDARIEWKGGPAQTKYLPGRLTQFQLKAGPISPAEAGLDVITKTGAAKPMIGEAIGKNGTYVMVCARSYTYKQIKARTDSIHNALKKAGLNINSDNIQFRDADQIASWVNSLPPVAAWVLEHTQPGLVGPFKDWTHWSGRYKGMLWVKDTRLPEFRSKLRALIAQGGVARVMGVSGIGKSRLVHEALGPTDEEENAPRLSDLVLYAVEGEVGSVAVKNFAQILADSGVRAILVVDRCPASSHQDIVDIVQRHGSRLSVITIDHEIPSTSNLNSEALLVELADDAVIEGMIEQIAPDLPSEDQRRLIRFASGFPQLAYLLGQAWLRDSSIAAASDHELFDRIIIGRKPSDAGLLKETGMMLGAFRLLGIKDKLKDIEHVSSFSRGRSPQDIRSAIAELQLRGVVQLHGRLVSLQPKPVAMALAERQWQEWGEDTWDAVLTGALPDHLRKNAANQLALLNDRPIATTVARHVTRLDGPLASLERVSRQGNAEIISALSEIDASAVISLLEHIIKPMSVDDLKKISGDVRRHLVWAIEKIAFLEETFERGAMLLLDLAVAENEKWSNNATGEFGALFPVFLSNTTAPAAPRLQLFDDLLRENNPERMPIVINALIKAAGMHSHSRMIGPEIHGSRPALEPWQPKLWKDAWDYAIECMNRLIEVALRNDSLGEKARTGIASHFRTFISGGLLDRVEGWTQKVHALFPYWPEALDAIGDVLEYDQDSLKSEEQARVIALIDQLKPQDILSRANFIITDMPWDFPVGEKLSFDERSKRQMQAVEDIAKEFLQQPATLLQLLPKLSAGRHRMAVQFGAAIAKFSKHALDWEEPIQNAAICSPMEVRSLDLLVGYYSGLAGRDLVTVEKFKKKAAKSAEFSFAVPLICLQIGITPSDVLLVCEGLKTGTIPTRSLVYWTMGRVFAKLDVNIAALLLDQLFEMDGVAYSIGLDILGMYVHDQEDRLDSLRPQLRKVAEDVYKRLEQRGSQMDAHHFEQVMTWLFKKGNSDPDARDAVLCLSKHLVDNPDGAAADLIQPLLPIMLSNFAPSAWSVLGAAITKDQKTAWRLERILGDRYSFSHEKKPALLFLPEDVLFAWAHSNPDTAPAFIARILPVITTRNVNVADRKFHPLTLRLLDEFGDREDVRTSLVQNMHNFGWSGSLTTYYALYEQPLQSIMGHRIGEVRRWAQTTLQHMQRQIEAAKIEDDERKANWGV